MAFLRGPGATPRALTSEVSRPRSGCCCPARPLRHSGARMGHRHRRHRAPAALTSRHDL